METIDRDTLFALADLESDAEGGAVREFISLYVTDLRPQIQALRDAFAGGDLVTVGRVAHTLRSSSAVLGALQLAESARALECVCRGELGDIAVCFVRLIDDAGAAIDSLNRIADEIDGKRTAA